MADSHRLQTAAVLLPVFGAMLFVPPLLGVFNVPATIIGIPVVAIYLFSVWIGLIALTFILSRRLGRDDDSTTSGDGTTGDRPR